MSQKETREANEQREGAPEDVSGSSFFSNINTIRSSLSPIT
jgi:hypothetical protein